MTSDERLRRSIKALGKKKAADVLARATFEAAGGAKLRGDITFSELVNKWKEKVLVNMKASSVSSITGRLTVLERSFGPTKIADLRGEDVQSWLTSVNKAPKTVQNYVGTLKMLWNSAKSWEYVAGDPFENLRLPAPELTEQPCFSPEQAREIIQRASEPFKTLFWIIAETGVRGGEAVGLKPGDVDAERGTIRIQRSAFKGNVQTPKTRNAIRSFSISQPLARHLAQFLASGKREFIFCTSSGRPLDNTWVTTNKLKPILREMGIDRPRAGLHGFRHGLATALDRMDVPMHERQARLGHSSPNMTLRYTHDSGGGRAVADKLGELFSPVEKANAAGAD